VSPLTKKLVRDLWRIKGQAAAIALVIAAGVQLMVMLSGLVVTLDQTRQTYYDRYRLADVFAPAVRVPSAVSAQIRQIPGVAVFETRIAGSAQIDLPGEALPIQAQTLSLPEDQAPALNAIALTDGRLMDPRRGEEVVLLNSFAKAHDLKLGDPLSATLSGVKRSLRIVGFAQSPEFLYTTAPGEMVPDDARFAVIWMARAALEATEDMAGAFNQALVALDRDALEQEVIDELDTVLDPFGGQGAYGLADHPSNIFVTQEIAGLRMTSEFVPPIFLAVAAFLLNMVIGRIVKAEREEIGLLKAFGYTSLEVSLHYARMVVVIAVLGAGTGIVLGEVGGRAMAGLYAFFFKFPFLVFQAAPATYVIGMAVSVAAALGAAFFVLRGVFSLSPAVAMRPPAPASYTTSNGLLDWLLGLFDAPLRMVVRGIVRQPVKFLGSVVGVAAGMALAGGMLSVIEGFTDAVDITFNRMDRSDMAVSFTHPVSSDTILALARRSEVRAVEPVRNAAVTFRHGRNTHRSGITGLVENAQLSRALDGDLNPVSRPAGGLLLSRGLAGILEAQIGDTIQAELLTGDRRTVALPVVGITDTRLGTPAYMSIQALNTVLGTPNRVTGAFLIVDGSAATALNAALKDMPTVAGVSVKNEARDAFQRMLDQGSGANRFVMMFIAAVIAFGIVYNTARIAYAEKARDLASLRVLGFHQGETAFVLLGELGLVVIFALPLGVGLGQVLSQLIAEGFSSELYQIKAEFSARAHGYAALAIVLPALLSGLLVRRDVARLDMITALKTKE